MNSSIENNVLIFDAARTKLSAIRLTCIGYTACPIRNELILLSQMSKLADDPKVLIDKLAS